MSQQTYTQIASSKGMDAVLLQENGLVAYALKYLTLSQQTYAQEMLAIVFGAKSFMIIFMTQQMWLRLTASPLRPSHPNHFIQPQPASK